MIRVIKTNDKTLEFTVENKNTEKINAVRHMSTDYCFRFATCVCVHAFNGRQSLSLALPALFLLLFVKSGLHESSMVLIWI